MKKMLLVVVAGCALLFAFASSLTHANNYNDYSQVNKIANEEVKDMRQARRCAKAGGMYEYNDQGKLSCVIVK